MRELAEHVDLIEVLAIGIAAKLGVPGVEAIAARKRGEIEEQMSASGA